MLDHADYTASTRQHKPDHIDTDQEHIFPETFRLTLLEPQSRFEERLLGIRVDLSPKRGCGSEDR